MKKIIVLSTTILLLVGCQNKPQEEITENTSTQSSVVTSQNTDQNNEEVYHITIRVNDEVKEDLHQEVAYQDEQTLLEAMQELYTIKETDGFIEAINEYAQDPDKKMWWLFTVNGEFSEVGANQYVPQASDEIEFQLSELE